jgi:serine/threonine-protein kinase RsbW
LGFHFSNRASPNVISPAITMTLRLAMTSDTPALPRIDFDSDSLKLRLQMEIPAVVERVDEVVEGIMKMVSAMECACGHENEIDLALREALANAVLHGAGSDPNKTVECRVACDEERGMLIVVADPGEGFDLARVPNPLRAENLYSSHGRGIFLINRLMDQVEFKRGGAEIHMRKFPKPE